MKNGVPTISYEIFNESKRLN